MTATTTAPTSTAVTKPAKKKAPMVRLANASPKLSKKIVSKLTLRPAFTPSSVSVYDAAINGFVAGALEGRGVDTTSTDADGISTFNAALADQASSFAESIDGAFATAYATGTVADAITDMDGSTYSQLGLAVVNAVTNVCAALMTGGVDINSSDSTAVDDFYDDAAAQIVNGTDGYVDVIIAAL